MFAGGQVIVDPGTKEEQVMDGSITITMNPQQQVFILFPSFFFFFLFFSFTLLYDLRLFFDSLPPPPPSFLSKVCAVQKIGGVPLEVDTILQYTKVAAEQVPPQHLFLSLFSFHLFIYLFIYVYFLKMMNFFKNIRSKRL